MLHFAALSLVGESQEQPERYWRGNVLGDAEPARRDARDRRGADRVLLDRGDLRRAGRPTLIDEDAPAAPVNTYGNTKLAVDRMLTDEARAHGLAAVSLRYFNVAGASGPLGEDHRPETHLIPLVLAAAAGKRDSVAIFGTDYPTPGRHRDPRLHPRRRPRRARTCWRWRRPSPGATTSTTSAPSAATRCAR